MKNIKTKQQMDNNKKLEQQSPLKVAIIGFFLPISTRYYNST